MNKFKKILIGLIVMTLIFIVGFVGTLIWMQSKSQEATKAKTSTKKVKTVPFDLTDPIVSNLKDNTKVNIRVVVKLKMKDDTKEDKKFVEEFAADTGPATTTIITVLRNKTVADVTEPDAPIKIGKEITDELNKTYQTEKFIETNYVEFLSQ